LEITISDPKRELEFYIDGVINEFVSLLDREEKDL